MFLLHNMDAKITDVLATSSVQLGAATVVESDAHGLCVASTGGCSNAAPYATSILQRAIMLHGIVAEEGSRGNPVVRVEADDT